MKFSYMSTSARFTIGLLIMAIAAELLATIIMGHEAGAHGGIHVPQSWADRTILPAVIVMLVSIFLTQHEVSDHAIIVRQGILIRCVIPLDKVADAHETSAMPFGIGVRLGQDRTLFVNTGLSPLVSIELTVPQRYWLLSVIPLWEMRRIVINVREPDRFVHCVRSRMPRREPQETLRKL
jgi:hypothetical protein